MSYGTYDDRDHPRGQPGNRGQWRSKPVASRSADAADSIRGQVADNGHFVMTSPNGQEFDFDDVYEPRPFFVYGILRPDHGGGWGRTGRTPWVKATLPGADMHSGGIAHVRPGTHTVVGCVLFVPPEDFDATVSNFDGIEGYRGPGESNHYDRALTTAQTEDGPVKAYVYLDGTARYGQPSHLPLIESGDYHEVRDLGYDDWL